VQSRLVRAPVVALAPVGDQLLHVGQARAVLPAGLRRLVGPAHAREPRAKILQHVVGHVELEGLGRHALLEASTHACQSSATWPTVTLPPLRTSGVLSSRGSVSARSSSRCGESPATRSPSAL